MNLLTSLLAPLLQPFVKLLGYVAAFFGGWKAASDQHAKRDAERRADDTEKMLKVRDRSGKDAADRLGKGTF